ncbi:PadR family transcriptional regulator [Paludibacterium purpuratum]|uniref:PadR family transcriptional regulator n=1 Tax=Paludibacterium purpuratum TaxID=1144873 RepID=A0A4R7AX99_9NEIS|nr:PadR family transcriptional regulator [Paludibacterium purpuratum]TDR71097.1 PadR family transcriptional regulator [Paludibacterium purpuratum]
MKTQLRKGTLEMCVLALLSRQDSYVYEIVGRLAQSMEIGEGTIYPLMRRLQADEWVSTYLTESNSGPARKYYTLTASGRSTLASMRGEWDSFVAEINDVLAQSGAQTGENEHEA